MKLMQKLAIQPYLKTLSNKNAEAVLRIAKETNIPANEIMTELIEFMNKVNVKVNSEINNTIDV